MRIIYNEGRTVGLSAYELYVRQILSEDPEAEVPSEEEWITRVMESGEGASLILKIASGTPAGYVDFNLPEGSQLTACETLKGYLFDGLCEWGSNGWATKVTDYGNLINPSSTQTSMPSPKSNPQVFSETFKKQASNYLKITSGIFFQPGTWTSLSGDYQQDLTQSGKVRFAVREAITNDVYILISGFKHKSAVEDIVPCSNVSEQQIKDGAFLGPAAFPWASKIVMVTSNDIIEATSEYYTMTLTEYNNLPVKEDHFYYCKEG